MKLKQIFKDCRIVALAGLKNTGKTNNLVCLIKEFREKNKETAIYAFGMPTSVMDYLKKIGVEEISSLRQLVKKRNCLLILDEFQKLKINDRRYKEELDDFIDFVYHNNVYTILSSPNIREFNSIIGGIIEKWLLKTVRKDNCINGSQIKKIIDAYKGRFKSLGAIEMPVNKLLVVNDEKEITIDCAYVPEADNKAENEDIFKIVRAKGQENVKELSKLPKPKVSERKRK